MQGRALCVDLGGRWVPVKLHGSWVSDKKIDLVLRSIGRELVPEAGIEPARLAARDFLTTSAFAASARCWWSGARLHLSLAALGARRLLSTPSRAGAWAWLGVGSDAGASRAFAEFDGLHLWSFLRRAQIVQVPCVYRFHHSGRVRIALQIYRAILLCAWLATVCMAEAVGFEPTKGINPCRFSRPVPSTARPRFLDSTPPKAS